VNLLLVGASGYVGNGVFEYLKDRKFNIVKTTRTKKEFDKNYISLNLLDDEKIIDNKLNSYFEKEYFESVIFAGGFTQYIDNDLMGSISDDLISKIINDNFVSTYKLLSLVQRNKIFSSNCKVIIISSTAGLNAKGSNIIYSAMKSAINSLVSSSKEWMREDQKVIALCPGLLEGGMTKNAPKEYIEYWQEIYNGKLPTNIDVASNIYKILENDCLESGLIMKLT